MLLGILTEGKRPNIMLSKMPVRSKENWYKLQNVSLFKVMTWNIFSILCYLTENILNNTMTFYVILYFYHETAEYGKVQRNEF
jgi:hypothetical protein